MSRADDRRRAPLLVGLPLSGLLLLAGPAVVPEAAAQTPGSLVRGDAQQVEIRLSRARSSARESGTPHAALVTHASPVATIVTHGASAAPRDEWVSLSINVTPEPGEHIYAQGAVGYQPVKLTVTTPRGIRLRGAARYPKAELYNFKALERNCPGLQRNVRDHAGRAAAGPAGRSLTDPRLRGHARVPGVQRDALLRYRDQVVSWSVALNGPGRQTGPGRKTRP